MTGAGLLLGWMVVGAWMAYFGAPADERTRVWMIVGGVFGPLWWFVRVDRERVVVHEPVPSSLPRDECPGARAA